MNRRKITNGELSQVADMLRRLTGLPLAVRFSGFGYASLVVMTDGDGAPLFGGSAYQIIFEKSSRARLLDRLEAFRVGVVAGLLTARLETFPASLRGAAPVEVSFCDECGDVTRADYPDKSGFDVREFHECSKPEDREPISAFTF